MDHGGRVSPAQPEKRYTPLGRRWICIEAQDFRTLTNRLNELEGLVEIEPVPGADDSHRQQVILKVITNKDGTTAMVQVEVSL